MHTTLFDFSGQNSTTAKATTIEEEKQHIFTCFWEWKTMEVLKYSSEENVLKE